MGAYDGMVAWVTGSGSGIGRATARELASQGASVLISDLDVQGAGETVALIESDGGNAMAVECDVTDLAQCEAAVAAVEANWGRLDVAVANAGIVGFGSV